MRAPDLLGETSLASCTAGGQSSRKAVLRANAVDAVDGVEVLHHKNLEARGAALARSNDGPSEEKLPNLQLWLVKRGTPDKSPAWRIHTLYQRCPYLAVMVSAFPTQLRYQRQSVAE